MQRTILELLNQLDGLSSVHAFKVGFQPSFIQFCFKPHLIQVITSTNRVENWTSLILPCFVLAGETLPKNCAIFLVNALMLWSLVFITYNTYYPDGILYDCGIRTQAHVQYLS